MEERVTTNIPDELTYHEHGRERERHEADGKLVMASRIVSAIFTPFMVPFLAFVLLFFFTYLNIMPLKYKLAVLGLVYCFTILSRCSASTCSRRSTDGLCMSLAPGKDATCLTS